MSAQQIILPPSLEPGDTIAIVSPAGHVDPQLVEQAVRVIEDRGYRAKVMPHALDTHGTYSAPVHQRLEDITEALTAPGVKAILCSRGGYGAVQLLDSLSCLPLTHSPKWLIGFSDISALHALFSSRGIASIHGPMARYISKDEGDNEDTRALFDLLEGHLPTYSFEADSLNRCGEATASLAGGNLAVLQALISTPYDLLRPGTILLIEDVAEPIYKVERMLYQLKLSGVLEHLAGVIVGDFTRWSPDANYDSMNRMIADMLADYTYPVAFNAPIGHDGRCIPLAEGLPTTLIVGPDKVTITQHHPE